jgi:hypothetical protein
MQSVPRYQRDQLVVAVISRVEAGSNTSTVALRVVEGDEKGTRFWGYHWVILILGYINTGTWPTRMGECGI